MIDSTKEAKVSAVANPSPILIRDLSGIISSLTQSELRDRLHGVYVMLFFHENTLNLALKFPGSSFEPPLLPKDFQRKIKYSLSETKSRGPIDGLVHILNKGIIILSPI